MTSEDDGIADAGQRALRRGEAARLRAVELGRRSRRLGGSTSESSRKAASALAAAVARASEAERSAIRAHESAALAHERAALAHETAAATVSGASKDVHLARARALREEADMERLAITRVERSHGAG